MMINAYPKTFLKIDAYAKNNKESFDDGKAFSKVLIDNGIMKNRIIIVNRNTNNEPYLTLTIYSRFV